MKIAVGTLLFTVGDMNINSWQKIIFKNIWPI